MVNINGVITPIAEGRISVLDHGFLFGDNIYETLRTYNQKPFLFSRHFERLETVRARCLHGSPLTREQLFARDASDDLKAAGNSSEHRRPYHDHSWAGDDMSPDPESCDAPNTIVFATPLANRLPRSVYEKGVEVIVSSFYRSRQLGDAKTGNLLRSGAGICEKPRPPARLKPSRSRQKARFQTESRQYLSDSGIDSC